MAQPKYRNALPADGPEVATLFNRSFCGAFAHLYRPDNLQKFLAKSTGQAWSAEIAEEGVEVRLAETEGHPVGFAKLGPVSLPVEAKTGALELRSLYVLSDWHGSGVARALMDWVIDQARARQAPELYLSVYVDNQRARRFYERYGFRFVKLYDFIVGDQTDEDHILRVDLKERP
jgi:diamine N-acetyltransferase